MKYNLSFLIVIFFSSAFLFPQTNCESARSEYLVKNPDVKNRGLDPWDHFTSYSKNEGRIWPSCNSSRDPRRKDIANVFWNGTYPLYSLTSDIQISPNNSGEYFFWGTTNEDPSPKEYKLIKGQVNTVYKFIDHQECVNFCNEVRKSKGTQLLEVKSTDQNSKDDKTLSELQFSTGQVRDQNLNFFNEFVSKDDIGKHQVINPYNTSNESIIRQVDSTVNSISNKNNLINRDLCTLRKRLPNSEIEISVIQYKANLVKNLYGRINKYDYYKILDRKKTSRILKNYPYSEQIDLENYNVCLIKNLEKYSEGDFLFFYALTLIDINNKQTYYCEINQIDWDKLIEKSLIEKVENNFKTDFLFGNYGVTEKEYLDIEHFTKLKQDSIICSSRIQNIFGYTYIGQVENGIRSGFGTLINLFQDTIYKGIWKDDMPYQGHFYQFSYENKCFGNCENGVGLKITHTDCVYRGEFKDGKWEGKGEFIFTPNYKNKNNGYMTSTFSQNKEGLDRKDFTLNRMKSESNNIVIYKYYNGNIFFISKKIDDAGHKKILQIYNNGNLFSGFIIDDYTVSGTNYFQNGDIYIGTFLTNEIRIHGEGIYLDLKGDGTCDKSFGQFIDGGLNGIGSIIYSNGQTKEGLFEKGKFIKSNGQIAQEKIDEENRITEEKLIAQNPKEENKMFSDFDPNKVKWNYIKNTTQKCAGCQNYIQCSKRSKDWIAFETNLNSELALASAKIRYGWGKAFYILYGQDPYLMDVNLYECPEFCSNECKYYYNKNKESGY